MPVENGPVENPATAGMLGKWVYAESGEPVEPEDLPTAYFTPAAAQIGGALGLIILGLGATLLIDRLQGQTETS